MTVTYTLTLKSPCACPNRCRYPVPPSNPAAPPVAPKTEEELQAEADRCKINGRDLSHVAPLELVWPLHSVSVARADVDYIWTLGLCRTISNPPTHSGTKADPCTHSEGPGYVQQYREGSCLSDFNTDFKIQEWGDGVQLKYIDAHVVHADRKLATVTITCDKSLPLGVVDVASPTANVTALTSAVSLYEFNLRSRCACVGGCGPGATVDEAPDGESGGCGVACAGLVGLVSVAVAYVGLGMAYNKFTKGASALEDLLPHALFWQKVLTLCTGSVLGCCSFIGGRFGIIRYERVNIDDDDDIFFDSDENDGYL
uniref:Uncharacterized protein n=1 Tax=Eutreptiella gymnastica TaxID=73025 RepID=A0A7S1HYG3_9EUGL|mmetsp:Transcript_114429/g.199025  ORF Transcript_114429/g.199025 Transcript_114429/m.199025 type:complete len:313 (+) Transcript_114429:1-939(+)